MVSKNRDYVSTGKAAELLSVSRNTIKRLFDKDMLKGLEISRSKHRRINTRDLGRLITRNYLTQANLAYVLENQEDIELTPEDFGLDILIGSNGLKFHAKPSSYSTGDVSRILGKNIMKIIKWYDDDKLGGFEVPESSFRRISANSLVLFMRNRELEVPDEILQCAPISLQYPGTWRDEPNLIESPQSGRTHAGINNSDSGNEIRVIDNKRKSGIYIKKTDNETHIILIGNKFNEPGMIAEKFPNTATHVEALENELGNAGYVLDEWKSPTHGEQATAALDIIRRSREDFRAQYSSLLDS